MTVARDTQLSLVDGMERPVGPLPLSVQNGSNADLMAKIAPLYLTGSVLDATYGRGKWWDRFTPEPFIRHDLHTLDGVDFRQLPEADDSIDTVCFDPPYIPQGGYESSTSQEFVARFGLTGFSRSELWAMLAAGLSEANRVARHYVLVKCCDFVNGGSFHVGSHRVLTMADDLGMRCHDLIVHNTGTGPGGHNITEIKRARRAHSYLLVLTPAGAKA